MYGSSRSVTVGASSVPEAPEVPKVPVETPPAPSGDNAESAKAVRDTIIVGLALGFIFLITKIVFDRAPNDFGTVTDIVAVISPIIGAITTIAAAAFGVAAGAKAGESAGQSVANEAKAGAELAVKAQQHLGQQVVNTQQSKLNGLRSEVRVADQELGPILELIKTYRSQLNELPSPAGTHKYISYMVRPQEFQDDRSSHESVQIDPDPLDHAYAELQRMRGRLDAIAKM